MAVEPAAAEGWWLEQARAGDKKAFDALQKHLDAPVRRFIRRLIGLSEAEDDIARDVFLALYLNLEKLDGVGKLRPFVFRVARNVCYDELRRLGRFRFVSLDGKGDGENGPGAAPLDFLADGRPPPHAVAEWSLLWTEVQKAMDRLPELQRQTLILYCEEDLTYSQIAEVMATDIGTVKSRLHHARKVLVRKLSPEILAALNVTQETPKAKE